jgi:hypothetical protein
MAGRSTLPRSRLQHDPMIVLPIIDCLRFRLLLGFDCCTLLYPIDDGFVKGLGEGVRKLWVREPRPSLTVRTGVAPAPCSLPPS